MKIPNKIHQTVRDKKNLTSDLLENIKSIKIINPDYEYHLYDDIEALDFISKNYGQREVNAFLSINPKYGPAKADLFRYLLMYRCGGIYLDIKSTIKYPLNNFIGKDDEYILSNWNESFGKWWLYGVPKEYQQWHIICIPGHQILRDVIESVLWNIENYHPFRFGVGHLGVLRTTGPIAYSKVIQKYLPIKGVKIVDIESLGIRYSIFDKNVSHSSIVSGIDYRRNNEPIVAKSNNFFLLYRVLNNLFLFVCNQKVFNFAINVLKIIAKKILK